jgi:hypothetical protein
MSAVQATEQSAAVRGARRAARRSSRRAAEPVAGLPRTYGEDVAAAVLDTSPRTLQGWRTSGRGPKFTKLGEGRRGRVVYSEEALREFIAQRSFQSTTEAAAAVKAEKRTGVRGRR